MAFTDKILQYTGSNTGLNIPDAIKQAIDNTLGIVKARAPQLLPLFARKMTVSDLPDAGYNLSSKMFLMYTKWKENLGPHCIYVNLSRQNKLMQCLTLRVYIMLNRILQFT